MRDIWDTDGARPFSSSVSTSPSLDGGVRYRCREGWDTKPRVRKPSLRPICRPSSLALLMSRSSLISRTRVRILAASSSASSRLRSRSSNIFCALTTSWWASDHLTLYMASSSLACAACAVATIRASLTTLILSKTSARRRSASSARSRSLAS